MKGPRLAGKRRSRQARNRPGLTLRPGCGTVTAAMIRGIDHINIVVGDLERSVTFYTELLGFTETKRVHMEGAWIEEIVGLKDVTADVVFVVAPAGEARLELLQYHTPAGAPHGPNASPNTPGLRHLALRCDDIAAAAARLKAAGVTLFAERPVTVPEGVVRHDAGRKQLLYFLDPDGVILELAQYD